MQVGVVGEDLWALEAFLLATQLASGGDILGKWKASTAVGLRQ